MGMYLTDQRHKLYIGELDLIKTTVVELEGFNLEANEWRPNRGSKISSDVYALEVRFRCRSMLTCLVVTLRVRSTFSGSIDVLELWPRSAEYRARISRSNRHNPEWMWRNFGTSIQ